MASKMDMASKYGKMAASMTGNGRTTKQMVMESSFMQMVTYTKGLGAMIKLMVMGHINMLMAQLMLANGLKINSMDVE